jgi:hypothetical protein
MKQARKKKKKGGGNEVILNKRQEEVFSSLNKEASTRNKPKEHSTTQHRGEESV